MMMMMFMMMLVFCVFGLRAEGWPERWSRSHLFDLRSKHSNTQHNQNTQAYNYKHANTQVQKALKALKTEHFCLVKSIWYFFLKHSHAADSVLNSKKRQARHSQNQAQNTSNSLKKPKISDMCSTWQNMMMEISRWGLIWLVGDPSRNPGWGRRSPTEKKDCSKKGGGL